MLKTGDSDLIQLEKFSGTGSSQTVTRYPVITLSSQIASQGHNIRNLGRFPTGGPFQLYKYRAAIGTVTLPAYKHPTYGWKGGTFMGRIDAMKRPTDLVSVKSTLALIEQKAYSGGATAIALANPVRPEVDMMTAVAETMKDGLPSIAGSSLWREQASAAKKAGGEYLNVQFGWLPLVSDIRKFAKTVADSSAIIRQYEKDSGKRQRRGFGYPVLVTPETATTSIANSYPADTMIFDNGTQMVTLSSETNLWFEGAFRYHLAPSGLLRYQQLASKLYGVRLTPDVLWNLAPWTWALDWFGNFGDVLTNVSSLGSDACVMEWGYMMHEQKETQRLTQSNLGNTGAGWHPSARGKNFSFNTEVTNSYKVRIVANPYGFSVAPVALSVKQQAILVALGLSRMA
jgi:hypothetical protein